MGMGLLAPVRSRVGLVQAGQGVVVCVVCEGLRQGVGLVWWCVWCVRTPTGAIVSGPAVKPIRRRDPLEVRVRSGHRSVVTGPAS